MTEPTTTDTEVPSAGEIRFLRAMRLLCGLAATACAVMGAVRIAEADGAVAEILTTAVAVTTCALLCAHAGVRADQLQTLRDEAATAAPIDEPT